MSAKRPHINELQALLGYNFKDRGLLEEALTHASARSSRQGRDNERLEFLGDRVLGLAIAATLYRRFPKAREVEFARHFNALVCKEACAAVAHRLQLGDYIIMAASEAQSGGRTKTVIVADACEAVLGAIFIDGGYAAAEEVVQRLWAPLIATAEMPTPDAKTALQEFAQSRGLGLPKYREIERSGADHAPSFTVEVKVQGLEPARGAGSSLKKAQQAAAEALLVREAIWQREHEHV